MSTPSKPETRAISVDYLARVEGEGSLKARVRDGKVEITEFGIFEPPRFYEAFLRGPPLRRRPRHHRPHLRDLPRRPTR